MMCVRVFVYLLALESSGLAWHGMTSFFYASYVTFFASLFLLSWRRRTKKVSQPVGQMLSFPLPCTLYWPDGETD